MFFINFLLVFLKKRITEYLSPYVEFIYWACNNGIEPV